MVGQKKRVFESPSHPRLTMPPNSNLLLLVAFYSLTNPTQQITAHIYDVMRSELPNLELDAVFEVTLLSLLV
jgi:hypothetical protein